MPTITFSLTDEDVERIAKRLATKLADALKQVVAVSAVPIEHSQQQPSPPKEWLTLGDVQRMFQISRPTLYRWRNGGGLPVRRIGNVVRVPADRLREWAEKQGIRTAG
jgi:excisionase family DNA binding protein